MIPKVVKMDVYPVAGHDSMELNLSGAHAPYFTRNIVILTDSQGNEGVGEVPGGEDIGKVLEFMCQAVGIGIQGVVLRLLLPKAQVNGRQLPRHAVAA